MEGITEREVCGVTVGLKHFRQDVLAGLSRPAKSLPCKYLYDERGAQLFEAICELEEYYPTRTEMAILRENIKEIAALLGHGCSLVDLGSGNGSKTRLLLKHLQEPVSYLPVDVALKQLLECSARLAQDYPGLEVMPVCADYTDGFELPGFPANSRRTVVFYPGSTIGNFEPEEAVVFLRRIARKCGPRSSLLLGVDLKKDPQVLHRAYNDAQGVTAEFNLNLLARANRELEAEFELEQFRHHACYNEPAGRIEMHLVSRREQTVPVSGTEFRFAAGESIVTEHSYKYSLAEFHQLAVRAGFEVARSWTDPARWFSVHYLRPAAH